MPFLMMPRQSTSASLRVCEQRAPIPGGPEFDEEFARHLRNRGLFLVQEELERVRAAKPAPHDVFSRLRQALDVISGRGTVWVERRGR